MEPVECDLIVSLGTNCAMAYNLRHFYGISETGLLDWMITPAAVLPDLIRRRFRLVDERFATSLSLVDVGKQSVRHDPTGVLLFHAFTRSDDRSVCPDWRSEIDRVASKLAFLGARMDRSLSEARTPALFVYAERQPFDAAAVLAAVLDTYPGSSPVICVLRDARGGDDASSARIATVEDKGDWHENIEGHWAGRRAAWENALASLNVWLPAIRPSRALARVSSR